MLRAPARPPAAFIEYLIALSFALVVALPGYATNCGPSKAAQAVLPSDQTTSQTIVIGFLGGFVAHDDTHHPEVLLIEGLRHEYPKNVYFGLFENRKVDDAYRAVLNRLNAKQDRALSDMEKGRACILLFGHSWGASAVVTLARKLGREGIPVRLTVQVDSIAKPFHTDRVIPANVVEAANFYQTHGLIHGRSRIVAADPLRTTIIGNFQWEYKAEPKECRDFSWYARFFTKSHIAIECDPKIWLQVQTLLRDSLPNPVLTQTDSGELTIRTSGNDGYAAQQK